MAPHPTKAPERANRGAQTRGLEKARREGCAPRALQPVRAAGGLAGAAPDTTRAISNVHTSRAVPCCSGGSTARSPACHIKSITAPRPSRSHQTIHLLSPAFDFPPLLRAEPSRAARPYFNAAAAASACASRPAAGPSSVLRWRRSGEGPCRRGLGVDGGGGGPAAARIPAGGSRAPPWRAAPPARSGGNRSFSRRLCCGTWWSCATGCPSSRCWWRSPHPVPAVRRPGLVLRRAAAVLAAEVLPPPQPLWNVHVSAALWNVPVLAGGKRRSCPAAAPGTGRRRRV